MMLFLRSCGSNEKKEENREIVSKKKKKKEQHSGILKKHTLKKCKNELVRP